MAKVVRVISGIPRYQEFGAAIYDEQLNIGSTITAGTSVTLPASGTYSADELEIYLNGQKCYHVEDYAYVGSGTRTQVNFSFDLVNGDMLLFRKTV